MYEYSSSHILLMKLYFVGTDIILLIFGEECSRLVAQTVESI